MRPLTCAPIWTVTVAWSVPLAVTFAEIFRFSMGDVFHAISGAAWAF